MNNEISIPANVNEYYNKGLLALEKKNYDYAIELFSQALLLRKNFPEARHYLHLSAQRKITERPPALFNVIFNKLQNYIFLMKAILLDTRKLFSLAINEYEKILRSDPMNIYVLNRLAQNLLKENDAASALKILEEIKTIDPHNLNALKYLGQLYSQMDNYSEARQSYEAILKIRPHDAEAEKGIKNLDALGAIRESFGQTKE
ncbi:MAG: tetratricopeptide repeat protein [Candidatus Omnitrophota bacterium]